MKYLMILLVLIIAAGCAESNNAPNSTGPVNYCLTSQPASPDNTQARIVGFGDSITAGNNVLDCTEANPSLDAQYKAVTLNRSTYVKYLAQHTNMPFINMAVGGTTLPTQLSAIQSFSFNKNDIVVFEPGMNDAANGGVDPTFLANYEAQLRQAMAILASSSRKVYLSTTTPVIAGAPFTNATLQVYANIVIKIVSEHTYPNLYYVDAFDNFPTNPSIYFDSIHPNVQGEQTLANIYLNAGFSL